jgi:hypothetical protein
VDHQWKDLWVSGNTIYIGNAPISIDGGTLLVNGAPVSGSYGNANVEAYIGANIGAYQTFANANAATQATSINTINNALTSANVGIGLSAGATSQGDSAVAIGSGAGSLNQGLYSVAIGINAGTDSQGARSVAIGSNAGRVNQGEYAVAIGRAAGQNNQANNTIIINATSGTLNQTTANTFTVAPIREATGNVGVLQYNATTKEVTYSNTISIDGTINANQYNFANGVNILSTVGAGAYGNTQVATYLLNFDGDIEFTSSTAKIGNVDVITVGDHIRSPAYQFSNGVNILSTVTATANLSALTSNIGWTAVGATPPTFTTTSNGTKIVLWPSISNTMVDYAIGIEAGSTWFSIPQATSNFGYKWYAGNTVIATLSGNGTLTTANLTATGNVVQQSAYYETYGNISNSGGNLTCNFNLGTTFYAALTANVTANFTNVNAIASTVSGATIIVDQGATAYRIANVQVNGVNQTIRWVGASAGVGTASNTDVMSFSLIHLGGAAYRVLGQISNYG